MSYSREKFDQAVWRVVSGITRGRVMSYGAVARVAGFPRHARMVSKAIGRCVDELPWYRVIRSDYTLAFEVGSAAYNKQRVLLEKEGITFINGKAVPVESDEDKDLDKLLWSLEEK